MPSSGRGRGFFSWPFGRNNSQRSVREKIISHPLHPPGAFPLGQYPYAQRAEAADNQHQGPGIMPAAEGANSSGERSPSFTFDPELFRVAPAVANPVELPELVYPEQPGPPKGFLLVTKTIRRADIMRQGHPTLLLVHSTENPSPVIGVVVADWLDEHRVKVITPEVKHYLIAWGERHDPFIADLVRGAPEDLTEYTFNYLVPDELYQGCWTDVMAHPLRELVSLARDLHGPEQDRAMEIGDQLAARVRLLEKHERYVLKSAEATRRHLTQDRYPWSTPNLRTERSVDSFVDMPHAFDAPRSRFSTRRDIELRQRTARMKAGRHVQLLVNTLTERFGGEMDPELFNRLKKVIDYFGTEVANWVRFDLVERRESMVDNGNDARSSSGSDAKESGGSDAKESGGSDARASSDSARASSDSNTLGGEAEASPMVAPAGFI